MLDLLEQLCLLGGEIAGSFPLKHAQHVDEVPSRGHVDMALLGDWIRNPSEGHQRLRKQRVDEKIKGRRRSGWGFAAVVARSRQGGLGGLGGLGDFVEGLVIMHSDSPKG